MSLILIGLPHHFMLLISLHTESPNHPSDSWHEPRSCEVHDVQWDAVFLKGRMLPELV